MGDGSNIGKSWKYNALAYLQDLEEDYPNLFRLKLLGTHENFMVCDEKFAFVVNHNLLASGDQSLEREVGIRKKIKGCLDGNCQIDIGWGYLGDGSNIAKSWKYNALAYLQELEQGYPDLFRLKLLGTHENFLVFDEKFAFVVSHNFLASSDESSEREVGIRSSDRQIIEGLIDRFDNAEVLELAEINRRFATSVKSLDEVEYLSGVIDENQMEFRDFSMVMEIVKSKSKTI